MIKSVSGISIDLLYIAKKIIGGAMVLHCAQWTTEVNLVYFAVEFYTAHSIRKIPKFLFCKLSHSLKLPF